MNIGKLGLPIAVGNTAQIYLFENMVVKVFNDKLPDTVIMKEADKQEFAYSCGLHVPKIVNVANFDGKQAIIMEYIQGETIGDLITKNQDQTEYYMDLSVEIQQEIHQNEAQSIEFMSDKLSRQIENAPYLEKKRKWILIEKLNSMTFEKRLCHGDYHLFNLIKSGEKVTIIDWVDASAGDIRADVYRTYLLYSQFSIKLAEMYLHLYCQKSGLSKEEIFEWAPIIAAARMSEWVSSERMDRLLHIANGHSSIV
ncbi:aminoglycoside phosphotransferase family protein [Guptibacillus hwajinpoensis]|uniref:aminoglycoside phosphotransferase family protein n=1 Tax=Guptibacillus hwajinpoensis TaxID=208199 RepID=UPI003734FAC7